MFDAMLKKKKGTKRSIDIRKMSCDGYQFEMQTSKGSSSKRMVYNS